MVKACEWCGKEYEPKMPWGRFCCEKCGRQWHKKYGFKHTYTCQHCGKTYKAKAIDRNTYCSRECAFAHKAQIAEWHRQGMGDSCPIHYTICAQCGNPFMARRRGTKLCSEECRKSHARELNPRSSYKTIVCQHCGKPLLVPYGDKRRNFCSKRCRDRYWKSEHPEIVGRMKRRARHVRRARQYGNGPVQSIDPLLVYERDGWRCGICGKPVNSDLAFPHPYSASLDHIQPLAQGGAHTYSNVQCSHFICNSRKGAFGGGQMRLGLQLDIMGQNL